MTGDEREHDDSCCAPQQFAGVAHPDCPGVSNDADDSTDIRCMGCGAEVDHHLGCPDDPDPDYEAESEAATPRDTGAIRHALNAALADAGLAGMRFEWQEDDQ